jgi:hypothetical protein
VSDLTRGITRDTYDFGFYEKPTNLELLSFTAVWEEDGVHLDWETAHEYYSLGFNLYRADSLEGSRTLLNGLLIDSVVAPGSGEGATYTWLDDTVVPGSIYYYWLECVGVNSLSDFFGPVMVGGYRIYLPQILRSR